MFNWIPVINSDRHLLKQSPLDYAKVNAEIRSRGIEDTHANYIKLAREINPPPTRPEAPNSSADIDH